jgi:hypothetical protein
MGTNALSPQWAESFRHFLPPDAPLLAFEKACPERVVSVIGIYRQLSSMHYTGRIHEPLRTLSSMNRTREDSPLAQFRQQRPAYHVVLKCFDQY